MPADVVSLRRARKAKARLAREKTATDNRVAFGRSKAEKQSTRVERERATKAIDAHRRGPDET